MKDTTYNQMLMACAKHECEILRKEGGFVLDRGKFDPMRSDRCIYGQRFGSSDSSGAMAFKTKQGILVGFNTNK